MRSLIWCTSTIRAWTPSTRDSFRSAASIFLRPSPSNSVEPADQSLQSVLGEVKSLTEQLLGASCSNLSQIPTSQGVYAIYDKDGKIIYVGKGKNLRRRIFQDHLGGDLKMSTSTFRRSVNRVYGIVAGKPLKEWIRMNCTFAFVVVPDADLCSAVEAVTVRLLRRRGCKLLNA